MRTITKQDARERRTKFRFPLTRELKYKIVDDRTVIDTGIGQSINIGSGGVAFKTDRELKQRAVIELSISWPMLLDDTCPMRLIVFGRVLRSSNGVSACTIEKYEFRTQSRTLQVVPPIRGDSMLRRWANGLRKEEVKAGAATA